MSYQQINLTAWENRTPGSEAPLPLEKFAQVYVSLAEGPGAGAGAGAGAVDPVPGAPQYPQKDSQL